MELIFIRHGETEYNKHKKLMGKRIDAPLDEVGLEQAKEVVGKIPENFAALYSSPLMRARQTAEVVAKHFNKQIEFRDELIERDFGTLSGKSWAEIDQERGLLSEEDENLTYDYKPYGGESVEDVKKRLMKFVEEIKSKHANDTVVVVSHYGIIYLMSSIYPHKEHHKLTNTSVHKFEL